MNALSELKLAPPRPSKRTQPRRGPAKLAFKETGKREIGLKLPAGFSKHRFKQPD